MSVVGLAVLGYYVGASWLCCGNGHLNIQGFMCLMLIHQVGIAYLGLRDS